MDRELLKIAIYSRDEGAASMIRGVVGERGEVVTSTKRVILPARLQIIDLALPRSEEFLGAMLIARQRALVAPGTVLCALAASPFALGRLARLPGLDALIAKPVHAEQVQALLMGVQAQRG